MLLTVYYMAATLLQSFRLRTFAAKIARQLNDRISVVFFNYPEDIGGKLTDNFQNLPSIALYFADPTDATISSDLCMNQRDARIVDVLWHHGSQRGCTVKPRQIVSINPWITFPKSPLNIPIKFTGPVAESPAGPDSIFMLVEAKYNSATEEAHADEATVSSGPLMGFSAYRNTLFLEEFGHPVAWRVDSHFSFLLRTDKQRLLQFILASFLSENFAINNDLQLLRIECKK